MVVLGTISNEGGNPARVLKQGGSDARIINSPARQLGGDDIAFAIHCDVKFVPLLG